MKRWLFRWLFRRGWLLAMGGMAAAAGLAWAQGGRMEAPPPPPKVGDVITLRFHDGRDRTVKVLKSERQPDGSYLSEVRDLKTGEVFNLLDPPSSHLPPQKSSGKLSPGKGGSIPLPPPPPTSNSPSTSGRDKSSRSNRPLLNWFRSGSSDARNERQGTAVDAEKRPGLFQRLFGGRKKDTSLDNPPPPPGLLPPLGAGSSRSNGRSPEKIPVAPGATTLRPPPGNTPAPPSTFPLAMPQRPQVPPSPSPTATPEPPRAQPAIPPAVPSVPPLPSTPATANPLPQPTPSAPAPVPNVPPVPAPSVPTAPVPDVPPIPPITIPVPPGGGLSQGMPKSGIAPASAQHVSTLLAELPPPAARDLQPYAHALQHAVAPSARALAARALADSPHGATPTVKNLLFQVCQRDPAPFVRACCIDELTRLGYADPAFLAYLRQAQEDQDDQVRLAAQLALQKLAATSPSHR
ncbi:MAG: HEAT repeat domain-containing protein [Thermogemmata sp.]